MIAVSLCIPMHTISSGIFDQVLLAFCFFQVDALLQKLEKEIDDVDAKIGDRWRLLDRYVWRYITGEIYKFGDGRDRRRFSNSV